MTKTEILNVLHPGKTYRVDAARFAEAQRAVMAVLPEAAPGLTPAEIIAAVKPRLSPALFPDPGKAGWWVKAVQLDAEARGLAQRSARPPVRLWRSAG